MINYNLILSFVLIFVLTPIIHSDDFIPIRIFVDYTTLNLQTDFNQNYLNNIKSITNNAVKAVQYLLRVKEGQANLSVDNCIPAIEIDSTISGVGLQADLILFPFINEAATAENPILAKFCSQDFSTGRPNAGYIAFNQYYNFDVDEKASTYYSTSVLHSIIHILGFDYDLFTNFLDGNGVKMNLSDIILVDKTVTPNLLLYVHPTVLSTAAYYFKCPSITGIPMITPIYNGSIATHWDARYMLGDIMIDFIYTDRVLSEITLAFLESTGWYMANYFTGGLFRFGKGRGCDFLNKKCLSDGKLDFSNEFCQNKGYDICTAGRLTRGKCYINEYPNELPTESQLFEDPKEGGLPDVKYCPVSIAAADPTGKFYTQNCYNGTATYAYSLGESVGPSTSCFMTNMVSNSNPNVQSFTNVKTAVCYQIICDFDLKTYKIRVFGKLYDCPSNYVITSEDTNGELDCPEFELICTSTIECGNIFDCIFNGAVVYDFFVKSDQILTQGQVLMGDSSTSPNVLINTPNYETNQTIFTNLGPTNYIFSEKLFLQYSLIILTIFVLIFN